MQARAFLKPAAGLPTISMSKRMMIHSFEGVNREFALTVAFRCGAVHVQAQARQGLEGIISFRLAIKHTLFLQPCGINCYARPCATGNLLPANFFSDLSDHRTPSQHGNTGKVQQKNV